MYKLKLKTFDDSRFVCVIIGNSEVMIKKDIFGGLVSLYYTENDIMRICYENKVKFNNMMSHVEKILDSMQTSMANRQEFDRIRTMQNMKFINDKVSEGFFYVGGISYAERELGVSVTTMKLDNFEVGEIPRLKFKQENK